MAMTSQQPYDCFCVVDFEATCDDKTDFLTFPHEIIEFPVVVVNAHTKEVENTFHSFVRPSERPTLTDFCMRLTGIKQDQVDSAPSLIDVLKKMFLWLKEIGIFEKKFIFVTHGPCDFGKFLSHQCERLGFHLPRYMRQWIDIKKAFRESHGLSPNSPCGIKDILGYYRLDFCGNEHSGLEDARNVARIVGKMIEEGLQLVANDCLISKNSSPRNSPLLSKHSPKLPKSPSWAKSFFPGSPKMDHRSDVHDNRKSAPHRTLESWLYTPGSPLCSPVLSSHNTPSPNNGRRKRNTYEMTIQQHVPPPSPMEQHQFYFQSF